MIRPPRPRALLVACAALLVSAPVRAHAGGAPTLTAACAHGAMTHAVCAGGLGIGLILPAGWSVAPPGKFAPGTLPLWTPIPGRVDADLHMVIGLLGAARGCANDMQAANVAAAMAAREFRGKLTVTRTSTRVGGAPAVALRGLPGEPDFRQEIVVAHRGLVYGIYLFDHARQTPTPAQERALASLRFIARDGTLRGATVVSCSARKG